MRLRWLATAAILAAGPANADLTARYAIGPAESGMPSMIVEVNDRGDVHMAMGNQMALVVLDGVSYLIQADLQGIYVARYDDIAALLAEHFRAMTPRPQAPTHAARAPAPAPLSFVQGGTETVGGRTGTIWSIRRGGQPMPGTDWVISSDPELAPLGRVFARQFDSSANGMRTMLGSEMGADVENFSEPVRALLAHGAPLRMGHILRLERVDTGPVPAGEFVLPSTPLTRAQLEARLGWSPVPAQAAGSAH